MSQSNAISYPVVVNDVHEVTLHGSVDLPYWADILRREGLHPYRRDGNAEIMIITADLKWMGFKFRELSISVVISQNEDGSTPDGAYLIRAFNSIPAFAFMERAMFKTPYYPAQVSVDAQIPSVLLREKGTTVFEARICEPRAPMHTAPEVWEGPIYLPSGHKFYACLTGETHIYPFDPSLDALHIQPSPTSSIFQNLIDSHFTGREWHVRPNCIHKKSNTYPRTQ